jgi:oligopeptidase B
MSTDSNPSPPPTATRPYKHSFHGMEWEDPYFWLRNKTDPDVVDHLTAENKFIDGMLHFSCPFGQPELTGFHS